GPQFEGECFSHARGGSIWPWSPSRKSPVKSRTSEPSRGSGRRRLDRSRVLPRPLLPPLGGPPPVRFLQEALSDAELRRPHLDQFVVGDELHGGLDREDPRRSQL